MTAPPAADQWGTTGKFTHLHQHDEFSTLDGINRVDWMPEFVKSLGQDALAQTNHGNLAGAYRHFKACRAAGVRPVLGIEAYYSDGDATTKERDDLGKPYYHLVLLAKNDIGLKNLQKLSSLSYTEGFYHAPRLDKKMLADYNEGIFATTACLGSRISQLILRGHNLEAEKVLLNYAEIFPNRLFGELQVHGNKEQNLLNEVLMHMCRKHNIPMIVTNDCHMTDQHDKLLHEQVLCMSTKAKMHWPPYDPERKKEEATGKTRFSFGEIDVHTATHDHMWKRAHACGIPYEAIANTWHLSNSVQDHLYFRDVHNRYTRFQDLPPGVTAVQQLEYEAKEGIWQRMNGQVPQNYRDRIDHELGVIKYMGFSDYMLIVQQLIAGGRSKGVIFGPGRGSAAGSLVAFALRITDIDPIEYGLSFSRFLNPGRSGTPLHFNAEMVNQIKQMTPEPEQVCPSHNHTH